jgi:hypothetical protein
MSSVFNCVNKSDLSRLGKTAGQYRKLNEQQIRLAAMKSGESLRADMRNLVRGDSSLASYQDVGRALHVWGDKDNVHVGLPENHPLLARAQEMHSSFQVSDVAVDLAQQSGEVEQQFHNSLKESAQPSWWRMGPRW